MIVWELWVHAGDQRVLAYSWLGGAWGPLVATAERIALIAALSFPLQALNPAVIRGRHKWFTREFLVDLFYAYQVYLWALLPVWIATDLAGRALWGQGGAWFPWLATLPAPLQVLLGVMIFDQITYWRHRATHEVDLLWPIHAIHHTARDLDFLTTGRLHLFELMMGAVLNGAVAQTGLAADWVSLAFFIYLSWNEFVHFNLKFRWPGPLKYVLNSPYVHHWHHADSPAVLGKNYGVVFSYTDWLLGTMYYPEPEVWPEEYGFVAQPGEEIDNNILRQTVYPVRIWLKRVGIA